MPTDRYLQEQRRMQNAVEEGNPENLPAARTRWQNFIEDYWAKADDAAHAVREGKSLPHVAGARGVDPEDVRRLLQGKG